MDRRLTCSTHPRDFALRFPKGEYKDIVSTIRKRSRWLKSMSATFTRATLARSFFQCRELRDHYGRVRRRTLPVRLPTHFE